MWYLHFLERAGVFQKLRILECKNGLVLSNTRVPVSGTWSILFPKVKKSWPAWWLLPPQFGFYYYDDTLLTSLAKFYIVKKIETKNLKTFFECRFFGFYYYDDTLLTSLAKFYIVKKIKTKNLKTFLNVDFYVPV